MNNSPSRIFRIGSRSSPLAVRQANGLARCFEQMGMTVMVVPLVTSGDRFLGGPLRDIGGKGLFTKELDDALIRGEVDCAVHSYKDMPVQIPESLMIGAVLKRDSVQDVWIGREGKDIDDLAPGSVVGTASLRRQVQIKRAFPHLVLEDLRGNVGTRLDKLDAGEVNGVILAYSGLKRLGILNRITRLMSLDEMLPAPAQGALVVTCCENAQDVRALLEPLDHQDSRLCTSIERGFLQALDGSCRTPIGAYAWTLNQWMFFKGFIADPGGKTLSWWEVSVGLQEIGDPHAFGLKQGNILAENHRKASS